MDVDVYINIDLSACIWLFLCAYSLEITIVGAYVFHFSFRGVYLCQITKTVWLCTGVCM